MGSVDDSISYLLDSAHQANGERREQLLLEAAKIGSTQAYFLLGVTFYHKYISLKDRNGNPPSFINSYRAFPIEKSYPYKLPENDPYIDIFNTARHYLSLSVKNGYPLAHGYLGKLDLERLNFESAVKHFEEFYDSGDNPSNSALEDAIPFAFLSSAYYYGKYLPQSYEKAFKWADRSNSDPTSKVILGLCYLYGKGTEPDAYKAQFVFEHIPAGGYVGEEIARSYGHYYAGFTYFYGFHPFDVDYATEDSISFLDEELLESTYASTPDELVNGSRLNCNFSYYDAALHLSYSDLECAKELLHKCITEGDIIVDGQYEEELNSGGTLIATYSDGYIRYYIPGPNRRTEPVPDLRYNGSYIYIDKSEIGEYIAAWKTNFQMYEALCGKSGNRTTIGEKNMVISSKNGVGLHHNSPVRIKSRSQLNEVLNDYAYASKKFEELTYKIISVKKPRFIKKDFDIWSIFEKRTKNSLF